MAVDHGPAAAGQQVTDAQDGAGTGDHHFQQQPVREQFVSQPVLRPRAAREERAGGAGDLPRARADARLARATRSTSAGQLRHQVQPNFKFPLDHFGHGRTGAAATGDDSQRQEHHGGEDASKRD